MSGPLARTLWNIPYQRNPFFTGREDILSRLDRALHAEQRVALSQPQGISGLGGIGKTQAVVEYAYLHREEYEAVLWVRADSVTSLTSSMVELAQVLELPERNEQDQEIIVQAVLRWLRLHSDWLLIYDNIDDLSLAEPFLPKAGTGHLLFTTRAHALGGLAQRLDIQQMDPEVGALLLLRRASLLALQATLNMANPDEQRLAQAISQELDGLPLALDQAGAYIKETPCPLPDYLVLYQTRRSDILRIRGSFDQDYPSSVATTWSLSFEKISQALPAASELLNFGAFLAPDAIPEDLLVTGSAHLGDILATVVTHPLQFDQVCKEVLRFSLLQRGDEHTLIMHRLVQAVLRDGMAPEVQHQWMLRAISAVEAAYPGSDVAHWAHYERLLPHALQCATWIEQGSVASLVAARLLNQAGFYLHARGRYHEAEPLWKRVLVIRGQQLGASHSDTAQSLNNLATLYRDQGKYEQAEPLHQRALAVWEEQLGPTHPDTANSLSNLALLYINQGKYEQAEPLLKRALVIWEEQPGPNQSDTATCLDNLALLYINEGKYEQAEPLLKRALVIWEEQLGPSHPETATSLNNLAHLYVEQGKYEQAEPLYRRVLTIVEQQLGPSHPNTGRSLNNLAELYRNSGKYEQAEPLLKRALAIWEEQPGPSYVSMAYSLNNLALLYVEQGKYEQAEPLYQRALAIWEEQLGPTHPDTATCLDNLAELYREQGKYEQAEPLYQRALAIREQQLSPSHPDTAYSLNNLALLYDSQGKYEKAESLHQQALAIREQQLGPTHPDTGQSLNNLAALYDDQGRYEQAEPLYQRALEIREQQLGPSHPDTVISLNNLATLFRNLGKYEQAEPLLKRALTIIEQQLGSDHPTTRTIRKNYTVLRDEMKSEGEAES